jgi:hypothetical protein
MHERTHSHAREHDRPMDDSTPTDMSNMTCYGCGEKGHITKDPKCKNFGKSKPSAKMFVAQEILDEDDDGRADDRVVDQDRESGDHDWGACSPLLCYRSEKQMIGKRRWFCSCLVFEAPVRIQGKKH